MSSFGPWIIGLWLDCGLIVGLREGENSWRAADEGVTAGWSVCLEGEVARSTVAASRSDSGDFGFSRSFPGTMSAARASLRASIELL